MTVHDWLLDSDPALRWQVLRDLTGAPAEVVAAGRARGAAGGWGARLLPRRGGGGGGGRDGGLGRPPARSAGRGRAVGRRRVLSGRFPRRLLCGAAVDVHLPHPGVAA